MASFSNPAGNCIVACLSQSGDLELCPIVLARWLMLGTVAFICTISLASTALARQIKGQELGQSG